MATDLMTSRSNDLARYQLAFRTPGIIPDSESSRKQMRQRPNRRRNARDRPQRPQRLCCLTPNFGFRLLFSIMAFRAIPNLLSSTLGRVTDL